MQNLHQRNSFTFRQTSLGRTLTSKQTSLGRTPSHFCAIPLQKDPHSFANPPKEDPTSNFASDRSSAALPPRNSGGQALPPRAAPAALQPAMPATLAEG